MYQVESDNASNVLNVRVSDDAITHKDITNKRAATDPTCRYFFLIEMNMTDGQSDRLAFFLYPEVNETGQISYRKGES